MGYNWHSIHDGCPEGGGQLLIYDITFVLYFVVFYAYVIWSKYVLVWFIGIGFKVI